MLDMPKQNNQRECDLVEMKFFSLYRTLHRSKLFAVLHTSL